MLLWYAFLVALRLQEALIRHLRRLPGEFAMLVAVMAQRPRQTVRGRVSKCKVIKWFLVQVPMAYLHQRFIIHTANHPSRRSPRDALLRGDDCVRVPHRAPPRDRRGDHQIPGPERVLPGMPCTPLTV